MAAPIGIEFPPEILNLCTSSRFRPVAVNLTSRGMFTGKQLVDGPLYQIWQAFIEFPPLDREQWQALEADIVRAYENRQAFRLFDPLRQVPIGAWGNTGSGAGTAWGDDTTWADGALWSDLYYNGMAAAENAPARRDSLLIDGAPAGQVKCIAKGDVCEIDGFLYEIVNTANADTLGRVRANLRPALRESVTIGTQIIAARARGSFYVKDPSAFVMTRNSYTRWGQASLEFVEALP